VAEIDLIEPKYTLGFDDMTRDLSRAAYRGFQMSPLARWFRLARVAHCFHSLKWSLAAFVLFSLESSVPQDSCPSVVIEFLEPFVLGFGPVLEDPKHTKHGKRQN
jgi:hypothetical protein